MHAPMRRQTLTLSFTILFLLVCPLCTVLRAQEPDPERARAFQLYEEGKYNEALPAFEKLAAKYPEDRDVIKTYGFLVIGQTAYMKEATARKEARRRGRELLVKAQQLGANDALMRSMLEAVPPDGGDDPTLSSKKEAEDAMREGEAAFAKKDFSKAIEMYQLALLFDPKLYEAALFTGDCYYSNAEQKKAGEWFARAAAINPDREAAYRYWGDSLMKQGHVSEAGDKFVEAYLAEPYSRLSRSAFLNWGERVNININHPQVDIPANVSSPQQGQISINLDPNALKKDDKSGAGAAWLIYGLVRGGWQGANFAKAYPNEKKYRHSLKEEADALRAALKSYEGQQAKNPQTSNPSLQLLAKLEKEGLLESYILLALPDEGIAQDYPDYRREHLEDLRRYVKQYVLTGGGGQ
ncbi:MAG TPA: tetratricopeptide repeat protein [Pyrinomonadaceae bacterium]|nr:tetratricopeptide repeat protein [Pyrinomonadaceae bacterium]